MDCKGIRLAVCVLGLCTAGFADNMEWNSPGNNVWQGFYVSPYTATDTTTNQTISLFCIDYNDEIAPPNAWVANINTLSFDNLANNDYQYLQYGLGLSQSAAWDSYLEVAWLATQMENSLTDDYLLDVYQVADWLVFADNNGSEFSNESNLLDLEGRIAASGVSFQDAVYSALESAEGAVASCEPNCSQIAAGWSVVTGHDNNDGPVQEFLTYTPDPPSQTGLNPVPEPSQIILMFTLIALIAGGARRSALKRRLAARQ